MKLKLLGLGLAALLNGCGEGKLSHYTYGGRIACVDNYQTMTGICMENEVTGSAAYLMVKNERIPQHLKEKLELGRMLRVQDCEIEFPKPSLYFIKNCNFYR